MVGSFSFLFYYHLLYITLFYTTCSVLYSCFCEVQFDNAHLKCKLCTHEITSNNSEQGALSAFFIITLTVTDPI